ncbi:MAG: hypothetical protein V3W18_15020 [candidate division Zixibacteria bacterium]
MRRIIFSSALLILFVGIIPPTVSGQDNSALLDALDRIEARLNAIEKGDSRDIEETRAEAEYEIVAEVEEPEAVEPDLIAVNEERENHNDASEAYSENRSLNGLEDIIELNESVDLDISGFGDVYLVSYQDAALGNDFIIGQMEVDLETNLAEKTVLGAAIAYDSELESFGLGAFTMDFHLWDQDGGHFRPVNGIDHSGLIAGLFDIPFGVDWNVYPSIDRKMVSAPLTVENTHDGWSDYGLQLYAENHRFNGVIYGVNGFSYEWTDELGEPIDVEMKFAAGGRLGLKVYEHLEVGGSYGSFYSDNDKLDMDLTGVDFQFSQDNFAAKGEYISHRMAITETDGVTNTGYYIQGLYDLGRYFLVGRYDAFNFDGVAEESTRMSIGAGWVLSEGSELRLEYQVNSEDKDDVSYLQIVAGF